MAPEDTYSSTLKAHLRRLWFHGFLMGLGVVAVILVFLFFSWGWLFNSPEGQEGPTATVSQKAPAAAPTKPATVAATVGKPSGPLQTELATVLAKMAEANQKKDLSLLLSLYDPAFPDLPVRREEISRTWLAYDYRSLQFQIVELKSTVPDQAIARVVWRAETKNRAIAELKDLTRTYLVGFSKEAGQWRIKSLEKADKAG